MLKRCSKCKKKKNVSEFYNNKSRADGLSGECKSCHDPSPEKRFKAAIWTRYRLTIDDYNNMLEQQDFRCAICLADLTLKSSRRIDHDHSCNHAERGSGCCKNCVRGIICHRCNVLVGYLEQNEEIIDNTFAYLGWSP